MASAVAVKTAAAAKTTSAAASACRRLADRAVNK